MRPKSSIQLPDALGAKLSSGLKLRTAFETRVSRLERLAAFRAESQLCAASTLSLDRDPAVLPIDVVQVQRDNLAGSQSQSCEEQKNGVVALPLR
jgi:hypothetical protein